MQYAGGIAFLKYLLVIQRRIFVILNKTGAWKIGNMTKEKTISGNSLVSIGLAFLCSEEYDLACCGTVSSSNSNC